MKKIIGRIIRITLLVLLTFFVFLILKAKNEKHSSIKKGEITIRNYLIETFGQDNASKMKIDFIRCSNGEGLFSWQSVSPYWQFDVYTPLLGEPFLVVLDEDCSVVNYTDFHKILIKERNLTQEYKNRLIKIMPNLNCEITLNPCVYDVDTNNFFSDEYTVEELLGRSHHTFNEVSLKVDKYNKNDVIIIVKTLYLTYYTELDEPYKQMGFNISDKSTSQKRIYAVVGKYNANQLKVSIFTDGNESNINDYDFSEIVDIK